MKQLDERLDQVHALIETIGAKRDQIVSTAIKDTGFTHRECNLEADIVLERLQSFDQMRTVFAKRRPLCAPQQRVALVLPYNGSAWLNTAIMSIYLVGNCLRVKFASRDSGIARRRYREYIEKGISGGRRPDLMGGGLIRSAGGWSVVKALRKRDVRMKGDERILGDGDFVEKALNAARESLERTYELEALGYDFEWLVQHVAKLLDMEIKDVLARGKYKQSVKARALLCYWGTRELGMTTVALGKKLNLAQPTISQSVMRGRKIVEDEGLKLLRQMNQ